MDLIKKIRRFYIHNVHLLKPRTFWINIKTKGKRVNSSRILLFGKASYHIHKTAKINMAEGFLAFNRYITSKDPFIGNLEMYPSSEINIKSTFFIHSGCDVMVFKDAKLNLGSGYINRYAKIRCYQEITIGENVAISENFTVWDSDAHEIIGSARSVEPVKIGNNVWIGTNVTILKGVKIGDGAIIAAGTLVNKDIPSRCLAAGVPAKVLKENVSWK